MEQSKTQPYTEGSRLFLRDAFFEEKEMVTDVLSHLKRNDLRSAIISAFLLPSNDNYVYHATASVTLSQVQAAIEAGSANGLHAWYLDGSGNPVEGGPTPADIEGYVAIFDPSKASANMLKGFAANAKKGSIRSGIGTYLTSKRHLSPDITVRRLKPPHANPYLDFWAWSCRSLEYAGPDENLVHVKMSHHVLPILMHHFGCVCPSYEALEIIKQVAQGKTAVLDIGCGNGYWTLMLRRHGVEVIAVDNAQSRYRTCWIGDVVFQDGVDFLKRRGRQGGGKDDVLLLVYPITAGNFTETVLKAFKGDVVCVAGTQNANRYTCFRDQTVDEWMNVHRKEEGKEEEGFDMLARVPLPSFAGKDDALFVFRRRSSMKASY